MLPVGDTLTPRRAAIATWSLIALNALVFLWELTFSPAELQVIFFALGFVPARDGGWFEPEWVTSMFLHGDWLHLLGNLWTLRIFGDDVEDELGPARFLGFYLLCGVVAALAQGVASAGSLVPTIGASGAIAGVLGAYLVLFPGARVTVLVPFLFFIPLGLPAIVVLGLWFVIQLGGAQTASMAGGDVAYLAHVAGFVAGAGFTLVAARRRPRPVAARRSR